MKKIALLSFILGMITYTFVPKDVYVQQVRPLNVTQTQVYAEDDSKYQCFSEVQIKDTMLQIGEKITAENKEVCQ